MSKCIFCHMAENFEGDAFSVRDNYPVSRGHTLVISGTHFESWLETPTHVKSAMLQEVERVVADLRERFLPEGFNIGWNIGGAAGQTVPHAHLHVIPRRKGDVLDARGGIRGVIPEKRRY